MNPYLSSLEMNTILKLFCVELESLLKRQNLNPISSFYGGVVNPETGLDEHASGISILSACLMGAWASEVKGCAMPFDQAQMLFHANLAADYSLRVMNEHGLIDLKSCNYDSAPDAAFAAKRLATSLDLAERIKNPEPDLLRVLEKARAVLRELAQGMMFGGFHTPNHRWVISGALAAAGSFFPDLEVDEVIDAYVAEGFDIDPDGAYTEHSTGVYDAACNLSLLLLAKYGTHPEAAEAVRKNLEMNCFMFHADGSAETGLSLRQDQGKRPIPLDLGAAYLFYQYFEENEDFLRMANFLWQQKEDAGLGDLMWLAYILEETGMVVDQRLLPETHFTRYLPHNRFWRARDGDFTASVFSGRMRLLSAAFGAAYLSEMRISQSYFGVGQFVGDEIEVDEQGVTLRFSGVHPETIHRPGYDLPLGRPIEEFFSTRAEREYRALPPSAGTLRVEPESGGLFLHYETVDNYPGVLTQISFDFAPGGVWQSESSVFKPQAGQVIFLRAGLGSMIYGNHRIEIGPGAAAHTYWEMRDAQTAPGMVRVVIPLITPVSYDFWIRGLPG
ncbi:MAG: hypothetical protein JW750_06280 [Anaerolineaceae bacterium]|nr:hypothetical protein [Anaerolineaceae bacterium]